MKPLNFPEIWQVHQATIIRRLFLVLIFLLLFNLTVNKPLNRDEHQFIASAVLAGDGLVPYVDFPYFHMPYLVYIYAGLFQLGGGLLFTARLFMMLCAFGLVLIIYRQSEKCFLRLPAVSRSLAAAAVCILFVANPVVVHTAGLSWNHDLPLLLTAAAFLWMLRALRETNRRHLAMVSGVLIAMASGIRLSYAPLFAPFFLLPFVYRRQLPGGAPRWLALLFSSGFFLAMLPAAAFLAMDMDAFLFGNLGYAQLNTLYRTELDYTRSMDFGRKLLYMLEIGLQPGTLILLAATFLHALRLDRIKSALADLQDAEIIFILISIPFILLGTFAPTPTFDQYFYPLIFFLVMAAMYGFSRRWAENSRVLPIWKIVILVQLMIGFTYFPPLKSIGVHKQWTTYTTERTGRELRTHLPAGEAVLTLSPIAVLEAGLPIYPQFATGPFAFRTAHLLSKAQRERYGIIAPDELDSLLSNRSPAGILVGYSAWREEPPLNSYAQAHGYELLHLLSDRRLWVRERRDQP